MGHEIGINDGMAYTGDKPWHGLGNEVDPNTGIDEWKKQSGLIWMVKERPAFFSDEDGTFVNVPDRKVLVRSDTADVLSMVSDRYNVVQPGEVLEFYRDLAEKNELRIETAGSLKGGRRVWALAKTMNDPLVVMGQDRVDDYVLLATSYDGLMATAASRTSVRVVCWNTLSAAIGIDGSRADIRLPHNALFNPDAIKADLRLTDPESWKQFGENVTALAKRKVTQEEAVKFVIDVLYGNRIDEQTGELEVDIESSGAQKRIAQIINVYENGVGQNTRSANGTAWGLVNAITRFQDHERQTQETGNRLDSAWFGPGRSMKQRGWDVAMELVA